MLGIFPVITAGMSYLSKGLQQNLNNQQIELTFSTKQAMHSIDNIVTLKCYNTQHAELTRYIQFLEASNCYFRKQAKKIASQTALTRSFAACMIVVALTFGTYLVHETNADAGAILTTFWSCVTASRGFSEVLTQLMVLEKGRAAAVVLINLVGKVNSGSRLSENRHTITPATLEGDIEMRNITFAYPSRPGNDVLQNVSFFFPAHETTFVVGRSGSGKSTLSALLLKFYTSSYGRISIDGTKIDKIETSWLRNNVTLVQQDSVLFGGTVLDNIAICCTDGHRPSTRELDECISGVRLEDTIKDLPEGLNTKIGKGCAGLSGGQRQRIALARARLRNTPVLILDESTSALDKAGQTLVMRNIREWRRGKTTIVITHDLSQLKAGDFVYVLKHGKIMSEGYRSTVRAELERTSYRDMIGSPLTPDQEDMDLQQSQPGRVIRGLRPVPIHTHTDPSASSLVSTRSESTTNEESGLIAPSSGEPKHRPTTRMWFKGLTVIDEPSKESVNAGYELTATSRSRRIHDRLTIAPNIRPYSTLPTFTMRQTYLPQNVEPSTPLIPISIREEADSEKAQGSTSVSAVSHSEDRTYSIKHILGTVGSLLSPRDRSLLTIAFALAISYAAIPSISAWIMSKLFQNFHRISGWRQDAIKWSFSFLAVGVLDGAIAFIIHYLFETVGQAWIHALRCRAFDRIVSQPKSWFDHDHLSLSEICNILDKAADDVRDILGRYVPFILIAVVMMTVATIWSLAICWKLALVVVACGPVIYAVTKLFDYVSSRWESGTASAAEEVANFFAESFSDVRAVRALTLESKFHQKYVKATVQAFRTGIKRGVYIGICFGASESMIPFFVACVFTYGTSLASSREFQSQSILTVFSLMLFSMISASSILAFIPQISTSVDAANRLLRLVDLPETSDESRGGTAIAADDFHGSIVFKHLYFGYPTRQDAPVLRNLNLNIRTGQCTAIVGRSGCGKSTILSLLLGLYPIDEGSLIISSHSIRDLDLTALRAFVSYMPQQAVLFPMTIGENILYGLSIASADSDNLLLSATESAGIHSFISSLPSGYDTVVGEGGLGVSGGQAQRIALARVFARRPKILLFDEPTSALDEESAGVIRDSIRRLKSLDKSERPTIVIVTHSREMMEVADRIVVLQEGQVAEEGEFEVLMHQRRALWDLLNASEE